METSNGHWILDQLQLQALLCDNYLEIYKRVGTGVIQPALLADDSKAAERLETIKNLIKETDLSFVWPDEVALTIRQYTPEQRQTLGILLRPAELVFSWSDDPAHEAFLLLDPAHPQPFLQETLNTLDTNFLKGTLIAEIFSLYLQNIYAFAAKEPTLVSFYEDNPDVIRRYLSHALSAENPLPPNLDVAVDSNALIYKIHYNPNPEAPQSEWTLMLPLGLRPTGELINAPAAKPGCDPPCPK